jgi:catechol 2,3-dioxygenase-like lactoylglutathione lyase family enzyme
MKIVRLTALAGALSAGMLSGLHAGAQTGSGANPVLMNTCLITARFTQLVDFYRHVLGISPRIVAGNYAEFPTGAGVLAIFSAEAQEKYIPGSAEPASNKSAILEFKVANVDAEFARLQAVVKTWVKKPSTQPWGTRSFYFRDPDGNLIDFYTPVNIAPPQRERLGADSQIDDDFPWTSRSRKLSTEGADSLPIQKQASQADQCFVRFALLIWGIF